MADILNYDDIVNKAEEIETTETLTDGQVDEIAKTLKDAEGPTVQELREAAGEATEFDGKGVTEKAVANINPNTGKIMNIQSLDDLNLDDITLDDVLNDPSIVAEEIDPKKAEITKESVMSALDMFTADPEKLPLSVADIDLLISAVNRYKMGEKFAYFNAMPKSIQNIITSAAGAPMLSDMGNFNKHALNTAVEQFLESCVREAVMNQQIMDLNHSIAQAKDEVKNTVAQESSNMTLKIKKYFEEQIMNTATSMREHGDVDKADELESYVHAYQQSYKLEDFKAAYDANKIKVKKIEIEKFARTCESFNLKYSKSKAAIHDIAMIKPVLDRHMDKSFDINVIDTFIVAFIKYTMNMKPGNMEDHIFMYYFVTNILSFDYYDHNNEEDAKFHEDLAHTINEFLEDIREKISNKEK